MKTGASRLGFEIMSRNRFANWSRENEGFRFSYYDYEQSGFNKRFSPVVERIDRDKGFTEENLKWIFQKNKNRSNGQAVMAIDNEGGNKVYASARKMELELHLPRGVISRAIRTRGIYKELRVRRLNE